MTDPTTTAPAAKAKAKKSNGPKAEKHTITLNFDDPKYADLYDRLKSEAEEDDRPVHVYTLRLLKQYHEPGQQYTVGSGGMLTIAQQP